MTVRQQFAFYTVTIRKFRIIVSDNISDLSIKIMQKTVYNCVLYIYLPYLCKKGEVNEKRGNKQCLLDTPAG